MYKNFKHTTPIQIRFSDIDAMGHLNNAIYLTYFEIARVRYLDQIPNIDWDDKRYGLIVAKAEVNFKAPVFLSDIIEVHIRTSHIGTKSFAVEYEMVKVLANGERSIAATGTTVQVAYDYIEHKSVPLLEQWKQFLVDFEQNPELNSNK
jgi:acyl-CoA thioester hydrolase